VADTMKKKTRNNEFKTTKKEEPEKIYYFVKTASGNDDFFLCIIMLLNTLNFLCHNLYVSFFGLERKYWGGEKRFVNNKPKPKGFPESGHFMVGIVLDKRWILSIFHEIVLMDNQKFYLLAFMF
jgi:hypothetical protein